MLHFCTKNTHFTLNSKTYVQIDGVAMGSPLCPVMANIFMLELEQNIIPTLSKDISLWKRYIDDTICFVNSNCISHVLELFNSFHSNMKFTIETEIKQNCIFRHIISTLQRFNLHYSVLQENKYWFIHQLEIIFSE